MRPRLNRGRLIPPESVRKAHERLTTLEHEVKSIDKQLADPSRANADWRRSATAARDLLASERRQIQAWLATAEHPLFKEAYELLRTLRTENCDFDPPELDLITRLDKHFG